MSQTNKEVVFLQGKNVYLRPVCKEDVPHLVRWMNDEDTRQYLYRYLPLTEAEENEWVEKLSQSKTDIVLTMVHGSSGRVIGTMGLHHIDWKDRRATTGAMIGEKDFRDKGYGTEAKMVLLNYVFNELGLRKVCSTVFDFNARSRAYSEKCGYKQEGVLKAHVFLHGEYHDEILLAVFREDWLPLWEKFKREGRL